MQRWVLNVKGFKDNKWMNILQGNEKEKLPDSHWNSESEHTRGGGRAHGSSVWQASLCPIGSMQAWPPNWPNTSTLRERL